MDSPTSNDIGRSIDVSSNWFFSTSLKIYKQISFLDIRMSMELMRLSSKLYVQARQWCIFLQTRSVSFHLRFWRTQFILDLYTSQLILNCILANCFYLSVFSFPNLFLLYCEFWIYLFQKGVSVKVRNVHVSNALFEMDVEIIDTDTVAIVNRRLRRLNRNIKRMFSLFVDFFWGPKLG